MQTVELRYTGSVENFEKQNPQVEELVQKIKDNMPS